MDIALARQLTELVANAAGVPAAAEGLNAYGEYRLTNTNGDRNPELAKLGELRNLLIAGIEPYWEGYLAGDPDCSREYERRMRALKGVMDAWIALHSPIS